MNLWRLYRRLMYVHVGFTEDVHRGSGMDLHERSTNGGRCPINLWGLCGRLMDVQDGFIEDVDCGDSMDLY